MQTFKEIKHKAQFLAMQPFRDPERLHRDKINQMSKTVVNVATELAC